MKEYPEKYSITIAQDVEVSVDKQEGGDGGTLSLPNHGMLEKEKYMENLTHALEQRTFNHMITTEFVLSKLFVLNTKQSP